jgi:hypothetical protein
MQTAARHVQSEGLLGSSTLCLLTVNLQQGRLAAANLGDSGFMALGPPLGQPEAAARVRYRTVQLEHEFGRPFQLGHHAHSSAPEDAELVSLLLQPGDTIVMGSDGLFDNLSESEILGEAVRWGGAPRAAAGCTRCSCRALGAAPDAGPWRPPCCLPPLPFQQPLPLPSSRQAWEAWAACAEGPLPCRPCRRLAGCAAPARAPLPWCSTWPSWRTTPAATGGG